MDIGTHNEQEYIRLVFENNFHKWQPSQRIRNEYQGMKNVSYLSFSFVTEIDPTTFSE